MHNADVRTVNQPDDSDNGSITAALRQEVATPPESHGMFGLFLVVLLTSAGLTYGQGAETETSRSVLTPGAQCDRKCGGESLNCYFYFILERYSVLTGACGNCSSGVQSDCFNPQCIPADGLHRPLLSINRTLPGPAIVVCKNDIITVDVDNRMMDLATTIHWHGIRQTGTPYMDGVPMVTQCPILPSTTFLYQFKADEAGTFFYHSHLGPQKFDGLEGSLIVRGVKSQELHRNLYDKDLTEHVIVIQDWYNATAYYWTPGPHKPGEEQNPSNILINGLGPLTRNVYNGFVPIKKFLVQQGVRYRFRLIGATCMACLYGITIQGHNLTVITTDGGLNIKPTVVKSISVNSGDRFDFVLNANNTVGSYYIIVELLTPSCGPLLRQVAVLEYEGSNTILTMPPPPVNDFGLMLNPPYSPCNGSRPNQICVNELTGEYIAPAVSGTNASYQQILVSWGAYLYTPQNLFNSFDAYEETSYDRYIRFTLNNISYVSPPSPLLTQFSDIPKKYFCSPECKNSTIENSCSCTNYYSIEIGTIVDLIVVDVNDTNHPFHLHGHNFYVLFMGIFPSMEPAVVYRTIQELRVNTSRDKYSLQPQPQKDSITIPAGGYAVLRFHADNPGWWMIHCHFVFHLDIGMAAVFKIGNSTAVIPRNFPRCGNFRG